jgi:hypothetical protein
MIGFLLWGRPEPPGLRGARGPWKNDSGGPAHHPAAVVLRVAVLHTFGCRGLRFMVSSDTMYAAERRLDRVAWERAKWVG